MKSYILKGTQGFVVSCLAACTISHGTDERTATTRQATTIVGSIGSISITPLPQSDGAEIDAWQGAQLDLVVADAWAACSATTDNIWVEWPAGTTDDYLSTVREHIDSAKCSVAGPHGFDPTAFAPGDFLHRWWEQRKVDACSFDVGSTDPATGKPRRVAPHLDATPVEDQVAKYFAGQSLNDAAVMNAARAVRRASVNLCIAQHLRTLSPGAAGGESLLFSAADQRQLLETIRERTQIAILQYAGLAEVFATPNPPSVGQAFGDIFIPILQTWAADNTNGAHLTTMSQDFAHAVDLHIAVSKEMATLLARSASARLPRGLAPATYADEIWGPGSWRERVQALLFGGDPLAQNRDSSAPWLHPTGLTMPGVGSPSLEIPTSMSDWPDADAAAYSTVNSADPLVLELERLARQFDAVFIRQAPQLGATTRLDPDGSAMRLYLAVEAGLRTTNCTQLVGSTCRTFQMSDIPIPDGTAPDRNYKSFELWTRHRITPAHAHMLLRKLAEYVGFVRSGMMSGSARDYPGSMNMAGLGSVDTTILDENGTGGSWYHVPRDAVFREKKVQQAASPYTHFAPLHIPSQIFATASAIHQGLQHTPEEQESARRTGAVSALVSLRNALFTTYQSLATDHQRNSGLLLQRKKILALVGGAVGDTSASITPAEELFPGGAYAGPEVQHVAASGSSAYVWNVTVTTGASDPFWDTNLRSYSIMAVPNTPWASDLALNPRSRSFTEGATITTVPVANLGQFQSVATTTDTESPNYWRFQVTLPRTSPLDGGWTLIVRKDGNPVQYGLLAGNLLLDTITETRAGFIGSYDVVVPRDGQAIGFGGQLVQYMGTVLAKDSVSPAQPAFDAFGFPTRWVPPSDPQLFAGAPGEDAVKHYLDRASAAASNAAAEVKSAFTELLKQQEDQAQLAAAVAKSASLAQLDQQALCGTANPSCDTSIADVPFKLADEWNGYAYSHTPNSTPYDTAVRYCADPGNAISNHPTGIEIANHLNCLAINFFLLVPKNLRLATAVKKHQFDPSVPTFSDYGGGTFQKVLIEQWTSLHSLRDNVRTVLSAIDAASARARAFATIVENDQQRWNSAAEKRCSPDALVQSIIDLSCMASHSSGGDPSPLNLTPNLLSGFTGCVTTSSNDTDLGWDQEVSGPSTSSGSSVGGGVSVWGIGINFGQSEGTSQPGSFPLAQKRRMCEGLMTTLQQDQQNALASSLEAFAALGDRLSGLVRVITAVLHSGADGAIARDQLKIAAAKQALEVEQLQSTQMTNLKLYRQVHSYDVWRARALLEDARIAAVTARRAIESRFVVDLSGLTSPEPFVAAPSTWSDKVYEYDLNMPVAVGLSVADTQADGIYPNQVLDYTGNLERFVNGFAVARPSAVAQTDTEVLSLPGPTQLLDGTATSTQPLYDGRAFAWAFECPTMNGSTWRTLPLTGNPPNTPLALGDLSTICAPEAPLPLRARIAFSLDAWGRVNGDLADEPYSKRYNARWSRLVVNLVGTGVLDCQKARDPMACYSQPFLRYELDHLGPAWVSDWDQTWTSLGVPLGRVEGAKALAAEQWLDPLVNSWTKPFVSAVIRTEYADRPLGGTYELTLDLGPEVRLDHIERVQLLADSTYWVKQQ